jgi:hypothetical protein
LEGHVFDWQHPYISEIVDPRQFGNLKGVSTTHALVHLIHRWLEATDSPKTIVRSCILSKALEKSIIDHNILLLKLEQMKIPAILLKWCENFLRDRKQRVKLGNIKSSWRATHAGVPQGTRLGPLFFLVMINDLWPNYPMYKYVDDSSSYEILSHPFNTSIIQAQVDSIVTWSSSNSKLINVKKLKSSESLF